MLQLENNMERKSMYVIDTRIEFRNQEKQVFNFLCISELTLSEDCCNPIYFLQIYCLIACSINFVAFTI